ncbi:MAG: YkgJ family cysteine cluster protein [Rhodospirillales bacterium]|nr:YkgJ family cysteine cluster protein [Rhodospirillales bacterium]
MARYNCNKCPAYCCSYARIIVTDEDIARLADHHDISPGTARKRFTRKGEEKGERILRHRDDEHFTTICAFIDPETRNCTVYEARPAICREFPGAGRCGYYDFLTFERDAQDDPDWIATTG